jgi:hypothetical protein
MHFRTKHEKSQARSGFFPRSFFPVVHHKNTHHHYRRRFTQDDNHDSFIPSSRAFTCILIDADDWFGVTLPFGLVQQPYHQVSRQILHATTTSNNSLHDLKLHIPIGLIKISNAISTWLSISTGRR